MDWAGSAHACVREELGKRTRTWLAPSRAGQRTTASCSWRSESLLCVPGRSSTPRGCAQAGARYMTLGFNADSTYSGMVPFYIWMKSAAVGGHRGQAELALETISTGLYKYPNIPSST